MVNKDILILMAAYIGNVDRYARLHRPKFIVTELPCIIRGIYHGTIFTKWWLQVLRDNFKAAARIDLGKSEIWRTIIARRIVQRPVSCDGRQ